MANNKDQLRFTVVKKLYDKGYKTERDMARLAKMPYSDVIAFKFSSAELEVFNDLITLSATEKKDFILDFVFGGKTPSGGSES